MPVRRPRNRSDRRPKLAHSRCCIDGLEDRLLLSTFVVISNDDLDLGTCDVAHCSLREAINAANGLAGADTIQFDIPGSVVPTIRPQGALPSITDALTINGTSQSAGRVELDGSEAGAGTDGLVVTGGGSTLQGLVINRFAGNGIHLMTTGGNFVLGSLIGTDAAGSVNLGNGDAGIFIDNSPSNTIGGSDELSRNIISGNETQGIAIFGGGAFGNSVLGNFIGTDVTGLHDLGNGDAGVFIDNSPDNTVGGADSQTGNLISGNEAAGITVYRSGARGNLVSGNLIGTDVTGLSDLGNGFDGVLLNGAPNNVVGGTADGARNVISGNDQHGIQLYRSGASANVILGNFIGTDRTGLHRIGNGFHGILLNGAPNNTVGGTTASARNVISGNEQSGISVYRGGASENVIEGNYIGSDVSGTLPLGNGNHGVILDGSPGNTIGGTVEGAGNVIASNEIDGVQLYRSDSRGNWVAGNRIGTDATGALNLGNRFSGVSLRGASANVIGGTSPAARNIVSGNNTNGVFLDGDASDNLIEGNYIGTDVTGGTALANSNYGVIINSPASRNTVGGLEPGAGNVISANGFDGVSIYGAGANANRVLGNLIGTDASGTVDLGNLFSGVSIRSASENVVGGNSAVSRNIISGNDFDGVYMDGPAGNNVFQGNFIGTDITGTVAIGNQYNGIMFTGPCTQNQFGGAGQGEGNVISANGFDGIQIGGGGASENQVLGNFIGTDVTGTVALGNSNRGVAIVLSSGLNTIGGTSPGSGNLISSNAGPGVSIAAGAFQNVVQGNLIGTDRTGTAVLGNTGAGVSIDDSPGNTVGGTKAGTGNVISGNQSDGVAISGSDSSANVIQGNLIGTDVTGGLALPNFGAGVSIDDVTGVLLGGTTAEARNVISGNEGPGVLLSGVFSFSGMVLVQGNFIGIALDGTSPLGNEDSGVLSYYSYAVTVGGSDANAGNVIAFNGGDGVTVVPDPGSLFGGFGDSILSNSIFSNTGLGIDLGDDGVTNNGSALGHNDRSRHPNFPVLTSAAIGAPTEVRGSLTGSPRAEYVVQLFASSILDPSRFGEGARFVGSANVRANRRGAATFRISLESSVKRGEFVTATATDPDGNTSEFSRGVAVREPRHGVKSRSSSQIAARPAIIPVGNYAVQDNRQEELTNQAPSATRPDSTRRSVRGRAMGQGRALHAHTLVDLLLEDWPHRRIE